MPDGGFDPSLPMRTTLVDLLAQVFIEITQTAELGPAQYHG